MATEANLCLEDKLQKKGDELRASKELQLKQANEIAALQQDNDGKATHISSLEKKLCFEKEQHEVLNHKISEANQKMASLQAEASVLKQQLSSASEAEQQLKCELQAVTKKKDEVYNNALLID